MKDAMLTLHTNGMIPPALAVAICLEEKGVDYQVRKHDWRETATALEAFSDSLELTHSLEGEFPVLVDGGAALCDSQFIMEYLDDKHAVPALRPRDAYGQWELQTMARFLGERALPAISTLGVAQRFSSGPHPEALQRGFADAPSLTKERREAWIEALQGSWSQEVIAESYRKLALLFVRIEKAFADHRGPWVLGEHYTLADIAVFALAHPFMSGRLDAGEVSIGLGTREWHARVSGRPAVRKALALGDPEFLPGPEHARWG